jgi:outer membrane protein assembly factor BamA
MFWKMLIGTLAAAIVSGAQAAPPRSFILNGYRLSGAPGVNQDEMVAKLKHKPGDHITDADIDEDTHALGEQLKAHHLEGQLAATTAEKNGRVWILFDYLPKQPTAADQPGRIASQIFDGNSKISSATLNTATGLKPGDDVTDSRLEAAQHAIVQAYAQAMPGRKVRVICKLRTSPNHGVSLNWSITEPK